MTERSGRRMPAQWEPQEAVWLSWPHNEATWPRRFANIPRFFSHLAWQISQSTDVQIIVPEAHASQAREVLGTSKLATKTCDIRWTIAETNDCWIRDYGPTFVWEKTLGQSDRLLGVDWEYNAWGKKYAPWDDDNDIAKTVCNILGIPSDASPLCLEGGAIETDGNGRLLTTPNCLINDNRNPGWTKEHIARELYERIGVTEVVWLDGGGLSGDDTDGHIDQLARFLNQQNVVVAVCDDESDPNFEPLEENYRQLKLWGRTTNPEVTIHRLPIPKPRDIDGHRVPESYCNFLMLGRDRLLLPVFNQPMYDEHAIRLLSDLLPATNIEPIDCSDLVWGLGALHCASREQPKAI